MRRSIALAWALGTVVLPCALLACSVVADLSGYTLAEDAAVDATTDSAPRDSGAPVDSGMPDTTPPPKDTGIGTVPEGGTCSSTANCQPDLLCCMSMNCMNKCVQDCSKTPCGAGTVCCPPTLGCGNTCVPDCRIGGCPMGGGSCLDSGVCGPPP